MSKQNLKIVALISVIVCIVALVLFFFGYIPGVAYSMITGGLGVLFLLSLTSILSYDYPTWKGNYRHFTHRQTNIFNYAFAVIIAASSIYMLIKFLNQTFDINSDIYVIIISSIAFVIYSVLFWKSYRDNREKKICEQK